MFGPLRLLCCCFSFGWNKPCLLVGMKRKASICLRLCMKSYNRCISQVQWHPVKARTWASATTIDETPSNTPLSFDPPVIRPLQISFRLSTDTVVESWVGVWNVRGENGFRLHRFFHPLTKLVIRPFILYQVWDLFEEDFHLVDQELVLLWPHHRYNSRDKTSIRFSRKLEAWESKSVHERKREKLVRACRIDWE